MMLLHLLLACQTPQTENATPGILPTDGEVVVTIDDTNNITDKVIYTAMGIPEDKLEELKADPQFSRAFDQAKEQQALLDILYREAIKANLHTKEEAKNSIKIATALAEREVLISMFMKDWSEAQITDEKLKQWYDDHLVQFEKDDVDLSAIMLESQADADAVLTRLKGGEDFATIADEKNSHPQLKGTGGSIGTQNLNDPKFMFGPPGQQALLTTTVGGYTEAIPMGPGAFVILKLNSRNKVTTPLEEVKETIEMSVIQEEQKNYITELKTTANITYPDKATEPKAEIKTETK